MTGRGRPLRFIALVAAGWAGMRVVLLWPEGATLPQAIEAALPVRLAEAVTTPSRVMGPAPRRAARALPQPSSPWSGVVASHAAPGLSPEPATRSFAMLGLVNFGPEQAMGVPPGTLPPRMTPQRVTLSESASPGRWSASAWFVTRRGSPAGGPMLGGDQAGVRIAHVLDKAHRLSLYARASTPLAGHGRELALGVEWQPFRAPLRVVAEQRFALDGGGSGPALGIVAGVDGVALPFAFRLEAYGQAGAVARGGVDPFADGALRVTRELASPGATRIALGAGAWGAAQRDAARLDIGPSATARIPVGGNAVRVAIDWRERVAGDARPGSGPALSIGADF